MNYRITYRTMGIFLLVMAAGSVRAGQKATSANAARFESLKKRAGDWVEISKDGKPGDAIASSIRVTAAGSVVQETIAPGTAHEMVTMYYLDGPDLVLTHYCILGNQPRMRAEPGSDVNRLAFEFTGGGNLKSEDENHMHQATLTILGKDHFQSDWVACENGKPCHEAHFDLVRKQG